MRIFFEVLLFSFLIVPLNAWSMGKRPPLDSEYPNPHPWGAVPHPRGEGWGESLTLQNCYELSLRQSETLAIKKEEIEITEANFFKAASESLGDVNFVMTDSMQDPQKGGTDSGGSSVGGTLTRSERRERKFTINQPLFQGFKSLGALMGAGSLKKQRSEEWTRAKQLLFLDVANAFYSVLRYQKDLKTIEQILELYRERIADLQEREQIGRSRESEVLTARSRMKILEADLAHSRGLFATSKLLLEFLTGISVNAEQLKDEALDSVAGEEPANYLEIAEERPDVEAYGYASKTAGRGIIVAQSDLWPVISLEHNQYEMREGFQSGITWDTLFTIDIPLFQGGETIGNIKEAKSKWKQAKLQYSFGKRAAELEIKQAYQTLASSVNESKSLEEAAELADQNFKVQKEEYLRNLVSNLDVLVALESLHGTSRNANQAHYEMKENYWRYQVATGNCCESV